MGQIVTEKFFNRLIRATTEVVGPGRLTKFLKIDKRLNGKKTGIRTGLWIERGVRIPDKNIQRTSRIGVAYAEEWANKPYRFLLAG